MEFCAVKYLWRRTSSRPSLILSEIHFFAESFFRLRYEPSDAQIKRFHQKKKQNRDVNFAAATASLAHDLRISRGSGSTQADPPSRGERAPRQVDRRRPRKKTTTREKRQKWITGARVRGDTQPDSGFTGKKTIKSVFEVTVRFLLLLQKNRNK